MNLKLSSFFRSVKTRLTLWYALVLTLLLALFGFLMHKEFSRVLYQDADKNLEQEAFSLAESLTDFVEKLPADLFRKNEHFSDYQVKDLLTRWEIENRRIRKSPVMVRILKDNQFQIMDNLTGWQREIIFPDFERDSKFMETGGAFMDIHFQKKPIRLFYSRCELPRMASLVIQCGKPLDEVERALARLRFIIWVTAPLAVVAACFVGWVIIRRSFSPVNQMISEARKITGANLQSRLPRTQVGDEIDRLAETLNEMMDRIEVSTKSIREFSSDVSHELKTPLAIIRGEIDLALRRSRSPETLVQTLQVIGGEVNEMIRLVDDLMLLVRSDSRQLRFEKKFLSLEALITQVSERFRERAAKKQIKFENHIHSDVNVTGDDVYLKRLFSNLLDNALKFTPEGGSVEIILRRSSGSAVVEIKDTGMGIEPELQPKVFARFYRTDQARSHEGAGLGLNIAKTISDVHGGSIELRSVPGKGTSVFVSLPAAA